MYSKQTLNVLMELAHQPFLVFANQVERKTDNTLETLQLLSKETQVTAGRISDYLDIKPSSVTQIIKKLEETEMAVKVKSTEDARVVFVEITEKGKAALEDRKNASVGLNDAIFQGLSETEIKDLLRYLQQIQENLSSEAFREMVEEVFGDDRRWQQFSKMSAHFGRAREQMMERGRYDRMHGGMHGGMHGMFRDDFGSRESFFDRRKR